MKSSISVGRLAGAFGVRGELKCDPTSAGRTVFLPGATLRCDRGSESSTIHITAVRPHGRRLLLRVEGVDDADAAGRYAGAVLFAPRDSIALDAGEYLDDELAGCTIADKYGKEYGVVERVEHYPSSDMLVVGERMIPMVAAIVIEVDIDRRRITIDPPAGLLD